MPPSSPLKERENLIGLQHLNVDAPLVGQSFDIHFTGGNKFELGFKVGRSVGHIGPEYELFNLSLKIRRTFRRLSNLDPKLNGFLINFISCRLGPDLSFLKS